MEMKARPMKLGNGKYGPSEPASNTPQKNRIKIMMVMAFSLV
jgi:hypothetical protein